MRADIHDGPDHLLNQRRDTLMADRITTIDVTSLVARSDLGHGTMRPIV
jgi:hypothetical protein